MDTNQVQIGCQSDDVPVRYILVISRDEFKLQVRGLLFSDSRFHHQDDRVDFDDEGSAAPGSAAAGPAAERMSSLSSARTANKRQQLEQVWARGVYLGMRRGSVVKENKDALLTVL